MSIASWLVASFLPSDKLPGISEAFKADSHPQKINLGKFVLLAH